MRPATWFHREGPDIYRFRLTEDGHFLRDRVDNSRAIHEQNQVIQREGAARKMDWAAPALRFASEADYHQVVSRDPELTCWDKDIRSKAWARFMRSSASRPYRVRERL